MPTPSERRALLFFASVALLGAGWRTVRATGVAPPSEAERAALDAQIAAVDSARTTRTATRRSPRGPRAGTRQTARGSEALVGTPTASVDVDRATAKELETLPRIGPALARRIEADRDSNGAFGSLEALQRVKGIGPSLARELAPHVTFSAGGSWRSTAGRSGASPDQKATDRLPSQIIWRSPRPP